MSALPAFTPGKRRQMTSASSSSKCLLLLLLLLLLSEVPPGRSEEQQDLYSVLGVSRSATAQEIKQAYKRLARANHPDKSKDPGASDKFVRINEAYEVLSDPGKRREYDMFGTVQADPRHANFHTFHASPFAEFFFQQQQESEASGPALEQITLRQYQVRIAPDSWRRPALLFGLADLCFPCMRLSPLWRRLAEDLLPLGVPMAVVHAGMSSNLAELLRIDQVPAIIGVVDGVAYHYSGQLSLASLRDFYRSLFPVDTLPPLTDSGAAALLAGWTDNRPRVVLAKPLTRPPIRFLMAAYAWRSRLAFAYTDTTSNDAASFRSSRRVAGALETVLLFDEDGEVGRLESTRLETDTLSSWLEARRHLALPRLGSPDLAEELCPAQISYREKFLCAVLLLRPGEETGLPAAVFRREARRWDRRRRDGVADSRVRLVHAHADSQLDFLRALGFAEEPAASFAGRVLLLWRATATRVGYRWLSGRWNVSLTVEQLRETLAAVAEDSLGLTVLPTAPQLADENRPALPMRIWRRLRTLWGRAMLHLRRTDPSGPLLIGLTIAIVLGTAFVMTRLAQWEEQKLRSNRKAHSNGSDTRRQQQQRQAGPSPCETAGRRPDNSRMLAELEPSNYRRLISASAQGQISLVLVTDTELKPKLAADFARCLAPFAGVERLRFAVLDVGDRLGWYRTILEFVIGRKLGACNIRARNCSGTVLAVNGFRKYFCIYHPKIKSAMQRQFDCRFLGLHDSDESSEDSSDDYDGEAATLQRRRRRGGKSGDYDDPLSDPNGPLFERDLLAGLPNWLDRLFDGQLPRVRVDAWPDSLDVPGP